MAYIKFDEDGLQNQIVNSEEMPEGEGWYLLGEDTEDKFFHLVKGAPKAMTDEERETHYSGLAKSSRLEWFRNQRSVLLMQSDWTQLDNSKLSDAKKAEWEVYRQALRDFTQVLENDTNAELPKQPQ